MEERVHAMTLGEYFKTIQDSEIYGNTTSSVIATRFFKRAGTKKEVKINTAASWISGKRKCKTSTYFPDGLNDFKKDEVFNYFRRNIETKLRKLQEAFVAHPNCVVKSTEQDLDIFCWSLVNQFLDIINLPMLDDGSNKNVVNLPAVDEGNNDNVVNSSLADEKSNNDTDFSANDSSSKDLLGQKALSMQLRDVFMKEYKRLHIENFISLTEITFVFAFYLHKKNVFLPVDDFIEKISLCIGSLYSDIKQDELHENIKLYVDLLNNYKNYLNENKEKLRKRVLAVRASYTPLLTLDNPLNLTVEYVSEQSDVILDHYHTRLNDLYSKIFNNNAE